MTDRVDESAWQDRLVELHVLSAVGDSDAADAAAVWLACDDRARAVWDRVEQVCEQVRVDGGPGQETR